MPRLLRPYIPLDVRLTVLCRQLGDFLDKDLVAIAKEQGSLGTLIKDRARALADSLGCDVKDLRLDHDPPLGARQKMFDRAGQHIDYIPAANDPEHLYYRPHGPQFEKSHLIKTNVHGDHGQHPDRVLIVKNRKLEKKEAERKAGAGKTNLRRKKEWKGPKLRSANRWLPKGSRKMNWRRDANPRRK